MSDMDRLYLKKVRNGVEVEFGTRDGNSIHERWSLDLGKNKGY